MHQYGEKSEKPESESKAAERGDASPVFEIGASSALYTRAVGHDYRTMSAKKAAHISLEVTEAHS